MVLSLLGDAHEVLHALPGRDEKHRDLEVGGRGGRRGEERVGGRGIHSFTFQLNLSSRHRMT